MAKDNRIKGSKTEVKDNFNAALRIFGKKIQDSGLLKEIKDRMEYEKPAVARQRMKKQARKRWERQVEDMIAAGTWHKDKPF